MNGHKLEPVKLATCGTCRFGKTVQLGVAECWGAPPTPVVLGARPNIAAGAIGICSPGAGRIAAPVDPLSGRPLPARRPYQKGQKR